MLFVFINAVIFRKLFWLFLLRLLNVKTTVSRYVPHKLAEHIERSLDIF